MIGAFRVFDKRENHDCGTSRWVKDKVCYIMDAYIKIFQPIPCSGRLGKWSLDRVDPNIRPTLIKRLYSSSTGIQWNNLNNKKLI